MNKRKELQVQMPDGSWWGVPAMEIARARTDHYSLLGEDDFDYDRELNYTLDNNDELIDWAENNMNWDDVAATARLVAEAPACDFDDGWTNGTKEVITF